ncbi:MAG: GNAT family N-acetyltransferase, partial [Victivallales bacterium]|nr:GNAT family N-acetyltransferase [Victivallales bacterium]
MSITTRKLKKDELFLVRQVADIVWPVTFRKILSEKQIDYMMQMMYAPEVLSHEYDAGVQFHGVFDDDRAIGYFIWGSCNVAPAMAKLHKCYLLTEYQGKGIGSMMLREAKKLAKDAGFSKLRLNVNRHNEKAMKSYFRNGFKVVEMVDNPIGEGFFMNDFVMEAELADGTVETDGNEPRDEESAASGMAIRKAHGGVVKDGRQAAGNEALPMASDERMQAAVISGLADDFDYVCHIDYKTGQFSCFRASELFARALSDIDLSLPYLKRLELLFRKLVYAEDLPRFLECFAAERVLKELEDKPVYKFETRLVYNNKTAFFRIKFARDQEDSNGVILGLLNIDKQVRAEILQGEQEAKIQSLKQMEEQARRQEKTLRKLIECMDRESIAYTVETMLQVIVDYYDADRVFVFEPDNGSAALNSTYEWSRDGVPGIREKLQHVPYSKMKHIINAMRQADFCTTLPGADEGAYLQADCR